MSAQEKSEILALVADSRLSRQRALQEMTLPTSAYYRWLRGPAEGTLQDKKCGSSIPRKKLRSAEEAKILTQAHASPELLARQLALRIVNTDGVYVSESASLSHPQARGTDQTGGDSRFQGGQGYHRKTKKPNEPRATDCAHLKVMDWG